jgi:hypothetical protein
MIFIKVNGRNLESMVKVKIICQMVTYILDNIMRVFLKAMVFTFGMTNKNMKVSFSLE